MVPVLSDALVTFSHVVPALLVFSMSVLAASLLYAGFPRLLALLPRFPLPGRDSTMSAQKQQPMAWPCRRVIRRPHDAGGVLRDLLDGLKMLLSIVLFLALCVFTSYVGVLFTALLIAALHVFFSSLLPSALLVVQFLLSALLLLFCLQWLSEILAHEPARPCSSSIQH
ncbi:hypothetical protein UY3_11612 [Chelonia mydas]|uniref:Uncharacterized protein n=1 Tax=Chelonia mydas TaxID=8469 RepID=M7BGN5_CHEMY|nr:hypothetical protein UY3_11612 [Chelonia mydas]